MWPVRSSGALSGGLLHPACVDARTPVRRLLQETSTRLRPLPVETRSLWSPKSNAAQVGRLRCCASGVLRERTSA